MKKEDIKKDFFVAEDIANDEKIGTDFFMVNDITKFRFFHLPHKTNLSTAVLCKKGALTITINTKQYIISKGQLGIILPHQKIQYQESKDFAGLFIIHSPHLIRELKLNIKNVALLTVHLKQNPIMTFSSEAMKHFLEYCSLIRKLLKKVNNLYRLEMIKSLLESIFYDINNFQKLHSHKPSSTRESLFESFYDLVLVHYKKSREVKFYADLLCITPRYLSTIIKKNTGKSAHDWINEYVIAEAKALLDSTDKSIQQISNELDFANQSFFGKYFKKYTQLSPKEYRKNKNL